MADRPPIIEWRRDLGTDKDGRRWVCQCRYREQEKKFLVAFDYETDERSAFLRDEVVYADDYWNAHKRVYHSKLVDYIGIKETVDRFIREQEISE